MSNAKTVFMPSEEITEEDLELLYSQFLSLISMGINNARDLQGVFI